MLWPKARLWMALSNNQSKWGIFNILIIISLRFSFEKSSKKSYQQGVKKTYKPVDIKSE